MTREEFQNETADFSGTKQEALALLATFEERGFWAGCVVEFDDGKCALMLKTAAALVAGFGMCKIVEVEL